MKTLKIILMVCGGLFVLLLAVTMLMPDDNDPGSGKTEDTEISSADDYYGAGDETGGRTGNTGGNQEATGAVKQLTAAQFKKLVADYRSDKDSYIGSAPCVVDFFATWCGPCKQLEPILDGLADTYAGRVAFYKVDIDQAPDVSDAYGIQSIPTLFFCSGGKIKKVEGILDKSQLEEIINGL